MEQILFDFENDHKATFDRLENIMATSYWGHLSENDEQTNLLFYLLTKQKIKIFTCKYDKQRDYSEETLQEATYMSDLLRKRSLSSQVIDMLRVFSDYKPELESTQNNSLYYPDLKAFIEYFAMREPPLRGKLSHPHAILEPAPRYESHRSVNV